MYLPEPTGDVVCAYGELVNDQIAVLDGAFSVNAQVPGRFASRPGGTGPNTATAARNCGVRARFIGHCGNGPDVQRLVDALQGAGVEINGVRRGRYASALGMQFPSGETALVFDPGDRGSVKPADLEPAWLGNAAVLHLTSFNLYDESTRPAFSRMVQLAQASGVPISLDVAVTNQLIDYGLDQYRALLREIRPAILFCNDAEAEALEVEERHPEGVGLVVRHRGLAPAVARAAGGWQAIVPVADPIVEFDSIGAGDAFAGGFLAGWVLGDSIEEALSRAHASAALRIEANNACTTVASA